MHGEKVFCFFPASEFFRNLNFSINCTKCTHSNKYKDSKTIKELGTFENVRVDVFFPFIFSHNFSLNHPVLGMWCSIPVVFCRIYICFHHTWGSFAVQLQLLGEYFSWFVFFLEKCL